MQGYRQWLCRLWLWDKDGLGCRMETVGVVGHQLVVRVCSGQGWRRGGGMEKGGNRGKSDVLTG